MMTEDQSKLMMDVYGKLWSTDESNLEWNEIDDQLEKLEWLDDEEMVNESMFLLIKHMTGVVTCANASCREATCFVKKLVEVSGNIISLYKETGYLPAKSRYILANYLALSHLNVVKFQEL